MPLQPLIVPAQSNSFITAFTLCVLLPTLSNDELFDATSARLFGVVSGRLTAGIINELEHANLNQFPTLIALIQSHLRPNLVEHANLRSEDYQLLFESQEAFRLRVASLGRADSPSDEFEQRVLSDYWGVRIEIVHTLYPDLVTPDPTPKLYFSIREEKHYYFVESDTLPEMLRRELFPLMPTQAPQVVDLVRFQQAKSKNLLQKMFQTTSDEDSYLDNLSKNAGIMKPEESALSPADVKFVLRFNLENELRNIRTVVEQVQLTQGYDIAPLTQEDCTQKRIIYVTIGQIGFNYTIGGETGDTTTAFLEYSELETNELKFQYPVTIEQLRKFLPRIQDEIIARRYDITMLPQNAALEKNKIYVRMGRRGFDYQILRESGGITSGFFEYDDLREAPVFNEFSTGLIQSDVGAMDSIELTSSCANQERTALLAHSPQTDEQLEFVIPNTVAQLRAYLPKIRKVLINKKELAVEKASIGGVWSWGRSMGYSATTGGIAGASALGMVTGIGEIAGTGVGLGLIPFAGIPIAIAFFGAVMGAAWWGKSCAVEYEKTLDTVNQLLSQELYDGAAELLDKQLQQWSFGTRELFLTKQHETLMHFFVALCARKMGKFQKAYEHFILTYNAARSIDKKSAAFIAKLQLLELLKNTPPEQGFTVKVSESIFRATKEVTINRQEEAEKIIGELTAEFTEGFTEYYWYIIGRLQDWSVRFKRAQSLTTTEMVIDRRNVIAEANFFLVARDFYILKAYANGYGSFLEVLSTFYQGAILDYFCHVNADYLDTNVRDKLILELLNGNAPQRNVERVLALKKFEHTATLLRNYKTKYPEMTRNRAISATIQLVESFILKFYATWVDNRSLRIEAFQNIANTLGKERAISDRLYEEIKFPIDFLARIHRDFSICFEDEEIWLDELLKNPSQIAHLVSERTGDTMLHLLTCFQTNDVKLTGKVRAAVLKLREYRYVRNHSHETPLIALKTNDRHQLTEILYSEVISVGNAVGQVDEFLRNLHRNPTRSKHFILLEGPPGTGKTETVLGYLGEKQYIIKKWSGPDKESKWVGQFQAKVTEFFETTKVEARKNPQKKYILFVDEINSLCQEREGNPENGGFNIRDIAEEFQQQVDTLMPMSNICLVGTTNFPELVARGMISRAKRIIYDLPSLEDRAELLQHFFRDKRISNVNIQRMAALTQGWSIRSLQDIAGSVDPDTIDIDDELLDRIFSNRSKIVQEDFSKDFDKYAELTLPTFTHNGVGNVWEGFAVVSEAIRESFDLLAGFLEHPEFYLTQQGQRRPHILLYGEPGGGKTTGIRAFTKNMNISFVIIKAGITLQAINKLFLKVESYSSVVVCIDEIDKITLDDRVCRLLQEKMNGLQQNSIVVVGATNYLDRIPDPLLDRFRVTNVPALTSEQRGTLLLSAIRFQLQENVRLHLPDFQMNEELESTLRNNCLALSNITNGISIRAITDTLADYFGGLRIIQNRSPGVAVTATFEGIRGALHSLSTRITTYRGAMFGGHIPNATPAARAHIPPSAIVAGLH